MYLQTNLNLNQPPLKRLRAGRKRCAELSAAINASFTDESAVHPFGEALRELRLSAGVTSRLSFSKVLGMTEQTLQKLERRPLRSGSDPLRRYLSLFGLALTVKMPKTDVEFGHPPLDQAMFSLRCRQADLSQRDLAQMADVSRSTIQNLESGQPVKLCMLMRLTQALGASLLIVRADEIRDMPAAMTDASNDEQDLAVDDDAQNQGHPGMHASAARHIPTLAEVRYRQEQLLADDEKKAERIRRANIKRAPWYWDGPRRRFG